MEMEYSKCGFRFILVETGWNFLAGFFRNIRVGQIIRLYRREKDSIFEAGDTGIFLVEF